MILVTLYLSAHINSAVTKGNRTLEYSFDLYKGHNFASRKFTESFRFYQNLTVLLHILRFLLFLNEISFWTQTSDFATINGSTLLYAFCEDSVRLAASFIQQVYRGMQNPYSTYRWIKTRLVTENSPKFFGGQIVGTYDLITSSEFKKFGHHLLLWHNDKDATKWLDVGSFQVTWWPGIEW